MEAAADAAPPFLGEPRPIERGITDNHGHADWLSLKDLREIFPGPSPDYGGVVVGEAYRVDQDRGTRTWLGRQLRFDPRNPRTWGYGGKAELLIDPCESGQPHALAVAGSGGYKTATMISTLRHWTGSCVVLDPSGEVGPMVGDAREAMGQRTIMLTLGGDVGVNVLDWIDINDPMASMNIERVVSWICAKHTKVETVDSSAVFASWARQMITCFLTDLMWDDQCEKSLAELWSVVCKPESERRQFLQAIYETSRSKKARDLAGTFFDAAAEEMFSSICANATEQIGWLADEALASLVCGNSFKTTDIVSQLMTVFIGIPLDVLLIKPEVVRPLVGAFMNALYQADGRANKVLFELDEAAFLGDLAELKQARDAGRRYGVVMVLHYQSIGQLEKIWTREGKKDWFNSASWYSFAVVRDFETAREISELSGTFGAIAYSEGNQSGRSRAFSRGGRNASVGENQNRHEISVPVVRPHQVLSMRDDEQILVARGRVARTGRAIYFRRKEMLRHVKTNRFVRQ